MAQHDIPWGNDPARTVRGLGHVDLSRTEGPSGADRPRYRLGARLGQSGQVYEAEDAPSTGRLVIKLVPVAAGLAPAVVHSFTREATKVADLRHPHIAQVVDSGIFAEGPPFVALERLAGQTLDERLAGRGALPTSEVLAIVRGVASALSAAHAAGIVHRELRADNVFMAELPGYPQGFVKVLDFGVSVLTAGARAAGRVLSERSMFTVAPEQRADPFEGADERTDQFALAALGYRLFTGAEPSLGQASGPGFERLRDGSPRPADEFVRCPPAIDAVLSRAMSIRPEGRFDSVALFFRALEEALIPRSFVSAYTPVAHRDAAAPGAGQVTPAPLPVAGDVQAAAREAPPEAGVDDAPAAGAPAAGAPAAVAAAARPTGERAAWEPTVPDYAASLSRPEPLHPSLQRPPGSVTASLTQQFFAEGERQEASLLQGRTEVVYRDEAELSGGRSGRFDSFGRFESFDRVPRQRAPRLVAGVAAIAVAGFGIAAWSTGWFGPAVWRTPSSGAGSAAAGSPGAGSSTPAGGSATGTVEARPPTPPPAAPPSPPEPAAAAAAPATAPAAPVSGPVPPPAALPPAAAAVPAPAGRTPPPRAVAPPPNGTAPAAALQPGQGPLRGYVWSPSRRRLVRARVAPPPFVPAPSATWPPPPPASPREAPGAPPPLPPASTSPPPPSFPPPLPPPHPPASAPQPGGGEAAPEPPPAALPPPAPSQSLDTPPPPAPPPPSGPITTHERWGPEPSGAVR
jgi:serine/threonine-protein kinase